MEVGQSHKQKTIAIIPARGGSKRIPRKNIVDFFGKPMIAWTIEAAQKTGIFDAILVSTDDEEIAEISIKYGAEVPFLRIEANDDYSPISLATIAALKQFESIKNLEFQTIVQLMANCPLRSAETINKIYQEYLVRPDLSILTCFPYGMFNPWWSHEVNGNYIAKPLFPDELRNKRSQDQAKLYCPTGAIWISGKNNLLSSQTFYSDNYRFYPISWLEAVDIDDYEDLKLARAGYNILKNEE